MGNVSELVKIFVTNTGNGPDVFDVTYTGEWVENNTVSYAFEGFEVREISIPVNSGLVAPGSQSSVDIIVNSTKENIVRSVNKNISIELFTDQVYKLSFIKNFIMYYLSINNYINSWLFGR